MTLLPQRVAIPVLPKPFNLSAHQEPIYDCPSAAS
jgi:hypothetical protein